MAFLFKSKLSSYRDRRFPGTQEEFEQALLSSATVYVGKMSFYTTEELFTRAGEIKKIIMGLDKNTKTPCGFWFVLYYSSEDTEYAVKYIRGTILDDCPIRVDFDRGFQEGRQWGRGRSGGQARQFRRQLQARRDYHRKWYREDDCRTLEPSKRSADYDSNWKSNPDSRPNPHFRESGDSDDEEDDHGKRCP